MSLFGLVMTLVTLPCTILINRFVPLPSSPCVASDVAFSLSRPVEPLSPLTLCRGILSKPSKLSLLPSNERTPGSSTKLLDFSPLLLSTSSGFPSSQKVSRTSSSPSSETDSSSLQKSRERSLNSSRLGWDDSPSSFSSKRSQLSFCESVAFISLPLSSILSRE